MPVTAGHSPPLPPFTPDSLKALRTLLQNPAISLAGLALALIAGYLALTSADAGVISAPDPVPVPAAAVQEHALTLLPLAASFRQPELEISGLAWYQDILVLLPQYPHKWNHSLYGLYRHDIAAVLQGQSDAPLHPFAIPLIPSTRIRQLAGYGGLEAIAFHDSRVFLAVEAEVESAREKNRLRHSSELLPPDVDVETGDYLGYLLAGQAVGDLDAIQLDLNRIVILEPQAPLWNKAYETLLATEDSVIAFYEAYGHDVNRQKSALVHDQALQPRPALAMPSIEYRITDATTVDDQGIFWAINFQWPGEKRLQTVSDGIRERWGEGTTHARTDIVERLVAMQMTGDGIELAPVPPIQLQLLDGVVARNWEGIAAWDDEGFLLASDFFPTTLLAYVSR